jgi:Putative beta-barrel porin-2, OmpL-like. bbp2
MLVFIQKKLSRLIICASLLCIFAVPSSLIADDEKGKSTTPAKAVPAKADAPAPLTDRERMLLDRVEQLEKRVAELETRGASWAESAGARAGASAAETAQPNSAPSGNASASAIASAGSAGPEALSAVTNVIPAGSAVGSLSAQAADEGKKRGAKTPASEPFAFADWTWLTGNARTKDTPYDTKFFTPEFRADIDYVYDFNHPHDDTIGGSSEVFRSNEVHVTDLGVGGDFHFDNVRGRVLSQIGLYSQTTARNDASPSRGQWNLADAYRYVSEAYGGYHFNVLHGVNVDAGIFLSYIGLFSYYQFDNWAYQPSYVSSNTPWFFNGLRVQIYPTEKLKIETWFINGWQSYGRFNNRPGLGAQIAWRPNGKVSIVANQYGLGQDTLATPGRTRLHTDDSIEVKYYDNPESFFDKAAFSLTGDAGCETGGGVSCYGNRKGGPKQSFLGFMVYDRVWFHKDLFGLTFGGGRINNPGRYLVLLPPINGATAASGTPYFTENPGDPFKAWDASGTFDYMPSQYITFRWEFNHRAASVPYFTGPGGITPTNCPTAPVFLNVCGSPGALVPGFTPDLKKIENRVTLAILVKF